VKALLINGSPNEFGCTYTALKEVEKTLNGNGIESAMLYLGRAPIAGCIACGICRKTGRCFREDIVCKVQDSLDEYDAIVIGSPVYYAAPAGQLVCFLNRLFFAGGRLMVGKLGAAVVSCRRGGASSTFEQINKYFTISNMPIVSSQYWNQVHGSTPAEVVKDLEGMQTMRLLGENMAYMLKAIESAKKASIPAPKHEQRVWTNFIRE